MAIEILNCWTDAVIFTYDVEGATMRGAVLAARASRANLRDANLSRADLSDANLSDANLTPIRDDIWAVLSSAPREVPALIAAIKAGRVDGSTYSGECSCLVDTLATARAVKATGIEGLAPNSARPAERFFMSILRGDTPETSQFSALALSWATEWLNTMTAAFTTAA